MLHLVKLVFICSLIIILSTAVAVLAFPGCLVVVVLSLLHMPMEIYTCMKRQVFEDLRLMVCVPSFIQLHFVLFQNKEGAGDTSFPAIKDPTHFSVAHTRHNKV